MEPRAWKTYWANAPTATSFLHDRVELRAFHLYKMESLLGEQSFRYDVSMYVPQLRSLCFFASS